MNKANLQKIVIALQKACKDIEFEDMHREGSLHRKVDVIAKCMDEIAKAIESERIYTIKDYTAKFESTSEAIAFENAALQHTPFDQLPSWAQDVLSGKPGSSEYWAWLIDLRYAQKHSR